MRTKSWKRAFLKVNCTGYILFEIHHHRSILKSRSRDNFFPPPPGEAFFRAVATRSGNYTFFCPRQRQFGHFRIQSVSERNRRNREDVGFHRVSERRSVREYKSGHPVHGGAPTHSWLVSTRVRVCVYLPVSVHGSVIRGGSRAAE